MNQAAEQIKRSVSMQDVLSRYGFEPNAKGFLCCPFHKEKTPSFRIYADGSRFKCFGCGESGSVIDFTMKLFGIGFSQAILRMNEDFGLGISDEKPDIRKQREWIRKKAAEQQKKDRLSAQRKRLILRHRELWKTYLYKRPKTMDEPLSPEFVEALHNMEYTEYLIADLAVQEVK